MLNIVTILFLTFMMNPDVIYFLELKIMSYACLIKLKKYENSVEFITPLLHD